LLSILNIKKIVRYDSDLALLLQKSLWFYEYSSGKFNVLLGDVIKKRKTNIQDGVANDCIFTLETISYSVDTISLNDPTISIDLGGIAKGYIIDAVKNELLNTYGSRIENIFIDARGDCVFYGQAEKIVELENPFSDSVFDNKVVTTGAIITSGHNKQLFDSGSHVIGSVSDIFTITLFSESKECYELDALGTYLLQLSSSAVLEKIEFDDYLQDVECLIVANDGGVFTSSFWAL
jgi:thiamine biosynthesis lipoprotein ApbE